MRLFFRRHPQADKLPIEPAPLPLIVCIHGLGGSIAQFQPLLTSLVNAASCLSIDLPGCGLSSYDGKLPWDAYTTESLSELLEVVIESYRESETGQGVLLIGHSMGASLAAKIASQTSKHHNALCNNVVGVVAICPRAAPPGEQQVSTFRKLLWVSGSVYLTFGEDGIAEAAWRALAFTGLFGKDADETE